jgi:hypothetical protein
LGSPVTSGTVATLYHSQLTSSPAASKMSSDPPGTVSSTVRREVPSAA